MCHQLCFSFAITSEGSSSRVSKPFGKEKSHTDRIVEESMDTGENVYIVYIVMHCKKVRSKLSACNRREADMFSATSPTNL